MGKASTVHADSSFRQPWPVRMLSRAARLLVIALLTATVVWAVDVWRDLLAPTSPAINGFTETGSPEPIQAVPAITTMLEPGQWTFGGTSVDLQFAEVTLEALAVRAVQWPTLPASLPPQQQPERQTLDLLKALPMRETVQGNIRRLQWGNASLLATAFVSVVHGEERLLSGWVAMAESDSTAKLLAFTPMDQRHNHSQPLLPYGADAQVIAARHDLRGHRNCDIVKLTAPLPQLIDKWKRAGWSIEPLPLAGKDAWLCVRRSEQLWAIAPSADSNHDVLIVTRQSVSSNDLPSSTPVRP